MSKVSQFKKINSIVAAVYVVVVIFALQVIELGQVGTIVVIPLGFFYFFILKPGRILPILSVKPLFWYIIFFLFASFSILYSIDSDAALETQKKMLVVLLFTISVFAYALNSIKAVKVFFIANVIVLFILILYVLKLGVSINSTDRLEDTIITPNTYGYYVFTGLSSLFMLYPYRQNRKQKILYLILLVLGCIFSIMLVVASASRGASIIVGLLIIGNVFIISTASKKGILKKVIVSIVFVVSTFYLSDFLNDNYLDDSYLLTRFNALEERETPRQFHVRKALEIGSEHPFAGVGAGNYAIIPKKIEQGSFSHNTFTEVFANFGLFGVFIYLSILFKIGFKIRKNVKTNNKKMRVINYQILFFFFLFLLYNTLYIVYLTTIFMHFLFVVYANVLLIERKLKLEIKQKKYSLYG